MFRSTRNKIKNTEFNKLINKKTKKKRRMNLERVEANKKELETY